MCVEEKKSSKYFSSFTCIAQQLLIVKLPFQCPAIVTEVAENFFTKKKKTKI